MTENSTPASLFWEPSTHALKAAEKAIVPHLRATPTPATVQGAAREVVTAAVNAVDLSWLVGTNLPEGTPDAAPTAHAIAAALRRALLGEEDPEARRAAVRAVELAALEEARRQDAADAERQEEPEPTGPPARPYEVGDVLKLRGGQVVGVIALDDKGKDRTFLVRPVDIEGGMHYTAPGYWIELEDIEGIAGDGAWGFRPGDRVAWFGFERADVSSAKGTVRPRRPLPSTHPTVDVEWDDGTRTLVRPFSLVHVTEDGRPAHTSSEATS